MCTEYRVKNPVRRSEVDEKLMEDNRLDRLVDLPYILSLMWKFPWHSSRYIA